MTERTEWAIRLVNKFWEINPGALGYLLSMRALEIGVTSLKFPPGYESRIPDGLVETERSQQLGTCRIHIRGWSPDLQTDADRVLDLLKVVYPDPDKADGNLDNA